MERKKHRAEIEKLQAQIETLTLRVDALTQEMTKNSYHDRVVAQDIG